QVLAGLVGDLRQHGGRAGRGGGREEGAPQLLLRELGGAGERAEVQLEILRELRKAGLQVLDAHLMPSCSISILSMFLVGSFFCQLQAQTSEDWRASSTRRTSSTLRPTASGVTETNWMTLSGSTMKVARSATPSAFSTPSAWMSSCLMSDRRGKGTLLSSSLVARQLKCANSLSIEPPRTCVSRSWKSSLSLPNAAISVGQTKVKSFG